MERTAFAQRVGFFAASSLVLFGCVNPNTYTTPRTIGSGHFQGSVAGEAWGSYIPASSSDQTPEARSGPSLTPPTVTVRLGLGDSCEIGARVSNMSSLGGDIKWNPFRSRAIDLAIDPAFQISEVSAEDGTTETLSFLHVPLLVGVNLSRTVSLILTPGISWGFVSGERVLLRSGDGQVGTGTSAIWRFGLGADFRIMPGFALHPEITFLRGLGAVGEIIYVAGLGLNFGAMPDYDDVGGGPPPVPPPAAPVSPPTM
jgi:hypothetical protein